MYTALIAAFAWCDQISDGPERAEAILAQMQADYESGKNPDCRPSDVTFSAFLKCWETSGRSDAPEKMEAILMHLNELQEHTQYHHLTPTYTAFKHVISAWTKVADARSDAGDRALKLLDMVDEEFDAGKIEGFHAIDCYNNVLLAIARSHDVEKASKAYSLLKRMKGKHYLRARDFHAVLSACRQTGTLEGITETKKQEALRIASITFLEFLELGMSPEEDLYREMLGLHTTLLKDEDSLSTREKLVQGIFSQAPRVIQHSEVIHAALKPAVSAALYNDLILGVAQ